jgi:hypothetical protein
MRIGGVGAADMLAVVRAELWAVIVVTYLLAGIASWRRLLAIEAAMGERDLLLLSAVTFWGKIGKWALILSWPAWTVLPYAVRSIGEWFRGQR